jgi:Leucine-rich repeat (LRR) protein
LVLIAQWLSNNEGLGTKYADAAICITRNARGTRRSPGLQLIDGRAITLEDRLKALAVRGVNAAGIEAERWKLTLIASFGHSRVAKGTDFFERARSALFSDAGLSGSVDVSIFRSLLKLDLERNRVREIRGLESLICLRVCLLAGNPELETKKVLSQLKPHVGLEHLSIRPKPEKEKADLGFLKRILIALPQADRLCMIDGVSISAADRMAIVSETVKFSSPRDLCAYNVNLALLIASSPVQGRDYNPQSIVARRGVVNHAIQQLYGLSGLHLRIDDLVSVQCDFRSFTRLERLDLSRNAIDDVSALGLSSLPSLMWLDLRDNKIATPIPQLAAQIDAIPSLQVIALRGNPCLSSDSEKRQKANRLALLGSMQRVRSVDCSLRVLDTEITVNERVEAWQAGGLSAAEAETLRAQIALYVRTPTGALQQPASVLTLDLSGLDLLFVPLVSFTRLERLCLRGNRLQKVSGLGLEACTSLVSLDLRDNKLTSCNDIAVVCSSLKSLRALACCAGNIALGDNDADIRRAVISSLTMLCEPSCALRYLDEALLTVIFEFYFFFSLT